MIFRKKSRAIVSMISLELSWFSGRDELIVSMINLALCDSFFALGDSFLSLHFVIVSLHFVMVCKTNLEIWLFQDWVSDSVQVCFKTLIVMCLFSDLRVELDWTDSIKKCSVKHVVRAKHVDHVEPTMFQNMPNWKTCQAHQKWNFSRRKVYW